jgi:hypothetical protein
MGGVRRGSALRGFTPGLAGVAAALLVLVLGTGVALAPGGIVGPTRTPSLPIPTPARLPVFHPSTVIQAQLRELPYECQRGNPLPTTRPGQPEREGIICATRKEETTMSSVLITGEGGDGEVVIVSIKGELAGTTASATETLATAMAKLTYASIADPVDAPIAGDWVNAEVRKLRVLPGGDAAVNVIGDIRLTLQRSPAGDFFLVMEPLVPS